MPSTPEYRAKYYVENREKFLAYFRANKDKYAQHAKNWREKNREKANRIAREWRTRNPAKVIATRKRADLKKYGLSQADFEAILKSQGGGCAVCAMQAVNGKRLCVDHNHVTGKVRGIVCNNCNAALAHSGDNPERLLALANYLRLRGFYGQ